jgi:signal peptidase II
VTRHLPSILLALLAFGIDRIHKLVQIEFLGWRGGDYVQVTPFFDYVLVWNSGISYGLFNSVPVWGLMTLAVAALAALTIWWWKADQPLVRAGLALAIGGAVSNGLDRLLYDAVADFFHFHWQDWSFYIFNLADTAITLGVVLLILDFLGIGRGKSSERIAA